MSVILGFLLMMGYLVVTDFKLVHWINRKIGVEK